MKTEQPLWGRGIMVSPRHFQQQAAYAAWSAECIARLEQDSQRPFLFTKEIDSSSPYLYKAATTGQTLKSEMYDVKEPSEEKHNHPERIELRYEKITWTYKDGNIIHSDSWNERATA